MIVGVNMSDCFWYQLVWIILGHKTVIVVVVPLQYAAGDPGSATVVFCQWQRGPLIVWASQHCEAAGGRT